jgi:hypothetical protein
MAKLNGDGVLPMDVQDQDYPSESSTGACQERN